MWDFSIMVSSEEVEVAKKIYRLLYPIVEEIDGTMTSYETTGRITIDLSCSEVEKSRLEYHIIDVLSSIICTLYKERFLNYNLSLPPKSDLELFTFKKALVSFDRETDRFIVNKYLILKDNIFLDSFFNFKLGALKEKWKELVSIANDNSTYLLSDDSFTELLKFLIDNIDFSTSEVLVKIENDKIYLYDEKNELLNEPENFSKFNLVEFLLINSPRTINWCAEPNDIFLEKIFSKRLVYTGKLADTREVSEEKKLKRS